MRCSKLSIRFAHRRPLRKRGSQSATGSIAHAKFVRGSGKVGFLAWRVRVCWPTSIGMDEWNCQNGH